MTLPSGRIEELQSRLVLFYTGIKRTASRVAASYVGDLETKRRQMEQMATLVGESIAILTSGRDIEEFGLLLDEAWKIKKSLGARISNPHVDEIYQRARAAGALGGKISGAGGGGFMMLFVPLDFQDQVRETLKTFIHVPFKFEPSGSQVVYYDRQDDYRGVERDLAGRDIVESKALFK